MNKIKVIELLNMISKGEEVPKKIEYEGEIYEFNKNIRGYWGGRNKDSFRVMVNWRYLNNEVEILEEEKKLPEKIKSNGKEFYCDNIDSWIDKEKTSAYCEYLMNKYNELIDYLKSKGDE